MNSLTTQDLSAELNKPIDGCRVVYQIGGPKCPNPVTNVIVTTRAPGFCPVCRFHAEGFVASPGSYKMLTLEQFEAERRRGLYAPEPEAA